MFDLGDEFMIESYKVPWLIWVQLLVMILLLIVLVFGFGIFALDLSDNPNCSSASSASSLSSRGFSGKKPLFNATRCSDNSKVGGKESDERKTTDPAGTSKVGIIMDEESMEMNESSSAKDIALYRLFGEADHPCNYFDLAKEAFLKCLGLGYKSEKSNRKKHGGKRKD